MGEGIFNCVTDSGILTNINDVIREGHQSSVTSQGHESSVTNQNSFIDSSSISDLTDPNKTEKLKQEHINDECDESDVDLVSPDYYLSEIISYEGDGIISLDYPISNQTSGQFPSETSATSEETPNPLSKENSKIAEEHFVQQHSQSTCKKQSEARSKEIII